MLEFSTLLDRARRGEAEALDELHRRYADDVLAVARRRLSPELRRHYDTMDLAQSVFADVLGALAGFSDRGEQAFRHWLFIKVQNKIRDKLRKHVGRQRVRREPLLDTSREPASHTPSPSSAVIRSETMRSAQSLLDALEDPERTIVRLRLEEGLSWSEIAARSGVPSADAVRKRYQRCMVEIRRSGRGSMLDVETDEW